MHEIRGTNFWDTLYIKEISNDSIVHLADARNVTLRTHRVNGALVEVSCNPFTEDPESQSNQVSH